MILIIRIYCLQVLQVYGKTFMSNCIAYELLKSGKSVVYQTAPVLLESVIDYKKNQFKKSSNNFYESILDCDLLILDDLGTETISSMTISELFTIINTRNLNFNNKITKYSKTIYKTKIITLLIILPDFSNIFYLRLNYYNYKLKFIFCKWDSVKEEYCFSAVAVISVLTRSNISRKY